ncbi:MAG TPA: DUF4190 domain-containing protein [Thermoanaerobaculia bacterium]|nr:DUF4190 domain-containing protein [Thermoanaerobaculia bacterium]
MSIPISQPPQAKASSQATTALILGIVGVICCGLAAPIAWYLGNKELHLIQAGQSSPAGQGLAQVGKILGIVGSVLLILGLVWVFFMGGMAMLSAMAHVGQ